MPQASGGDPRRYTNPGSVQLPQYLQSAGLSHYFEMGIVLILIGITLEPRLISGPIHLDQV